MPWTAHNRPFLDPAVLARLGTLELKARTIVEGFLSGLHRSPHNHLVQNERLLLFEKCWNFTNRRRYDNKHVHEKKKNNVAVDSSLFRHSRW